MNTDFHLGTQRHANDGPLASTHVLVTRPVMPASRTAQRLAALGATPYIFPTIIIEPPPNAAPLKSALADLAKYHAAIFVSPSAAEMTIAPMGATPLAWPNTVHVYAPGPGTAEELHVRGVTNVEVPIASFDSEGLLELPSLQASVVRGKRIAIFRGNDGREMLREELTNRGAIVDAITAYHRRAPTTPPTGLVELLRSKKLNAVSAMSSDAVSNLVSIMPPSERETLFAVPMYASHERIAETARTLGFRNVVTTEAGDAGLITALLTLPKSDRTPSPPSAAR
jgi:uroporphyrinogen-III synthase